MVVVVVVVVVEVVVLVVVAVAVVVLVQVLVVIEIAHTPTDECQSTLLYFDFVLTVNFFSELKISLRGFL